jgi:hypothetical protein
MRVLGAEHLDTLTSIGNLASTFWSQGRWKGAEELDVQVMETSSRVLGKGAWGGAFFHAEQHGQPSTHVEVPKPERRSYFIDGKVLRAIKADTWDSPSKHRDFAGSSRLVANRRFRD